MAAGNLRGDYGIYGLLVLVQLLAAVPGSSNLREQEGERERETACNGERSESESDSESECECVRVCVGRGDRVSESSL